MPLPENPESLILAYDLGTTGLKTCLYRVGASLELINSSSKDYGLTIGKQGEAEQDVEDWWGAMAETTQELLAKTAIKQQEIAGVSFCSQMQALVLVDRDGRALRPAMSYMDQRAFKEMRAFGGKLPRIAGLGLEILLPSLYLAGAAAASVKDPVWKYHWVRHNEPGIFQRVYKWLDAKDYLIARATGRYIMSRDSAYATFLMDSRPGHYTWSPLLTRLYGVALQHLPEILEATEVVGPLLPEAAMSLGLPPGIPIFAGGGDASLIGVGSGAVNLGETHVYIGTSGWVSTVTNKRIVDTNKMIAAVVGVRPGYYNYFAEQETSGKCLEWVRDHLALDEVGVYLQSVPRWQKGSEEWRSLIDYLCSVIAEEAPGSGGVVFTPWLHGIRCPWENPRARGMFINIGLDTGKRKLIRAVVEGIAFSKRLLMEAQECKLKTSSVLRFAGGGALSDELCRILADVTGRVVEAVVEPQNAGAAGAAMVAAVGLALVDSLEKTPHLVRVRKTFTPDPVNHQAYERNYRIFTQSYKANKRFFPE